MIGRSVVGWLVFMVGKIGPNVFIKPYQMRGSEDLIWGGRGGGLPPQKNGSQSQNLPRIANAVQCHNWLSGDKDCHESRFSIVSSVISVSDVTNPCDYVQCSFWSRSVYGGAFFSSLVDTTASTNWHVYIHFARNCPLRYFCPTPKKVGKWDRATIPH